MITQEINFDHIWNDYCWWIIAMIGFAILLFFMIIVLAYVNGDPKNVNRSEVLIKY
jgi:uncharacterized membrane protein